MFANVLVDKHYDKSIHLNNAYEQMISELKLECIHETWDTYEESTKVENLMPNIHKESSDAIWYVTMLMLIYSHMQLYNSDFSFLGKWR